MTQQNTINKYDMCDTPDMVFKVLLLGDSGCGKTCILLRYCNNTYSQSHISTIGIDFKIKNVVSKSGKKIKLQMWDTAGQERFRNITQSYYRNSSCVLIVYDITDRRSFTNVNYWISHISNSQNNIPIVLIGNKSDDIDGRTVTFEEGNKLAKESGAYFFETSAKNGQNIEEAFSKLTEATLQKMMNDEISLSSAENININNINNINTGINVNNNSVNNPYSSQKKNCC